MLQTVSLLGGAVLGPRASEALRPPSARPQPPVLLVACVRKRPALKCKASLVEEEMKPGCSPCILHAHIIARMERSANTVARSPCVVPTVWPPIAGAAHHWSSNQVCFAECFERLRVCQRDLQPAPPRGPPGTLSSSLVRHVSSSTSSYWRGAALFLFARRMHPSSNCVPTA